MPATSKGRDFEKQVKKSFEKRGYFIQKIPDVYIPAKAITDNAFVPRSWCDFIVFDGSKLGFIECKTTSYKSINIQREESEQNKMIKLHQIVSLNKFAEYENVYGGLLLEFENELDDVSTYYWPIEKFYEFLIKTDKKSCNQLDCVQYGALFIPQKMLRTNYDYDVQKIVQAS